ncbi:actin lateral binding protein [Cryptococcus deuterogattii R265]|uniref:actin lateral binding protein n=1 Tax=Cryptococcus deuterogattii (strain R265) TaxID=294750 RepID=UPI001938D40A|nr:actin lateral binding protein [Cryptococcus deuterogattii R265]
MRCIYKQYLTLYSVRRWIITELQKEKRKCEHLNPHTTAQPPTFRGNGHGQSCGAHSRKENVLAPFSAEPTISDKIKERFAILGQKIEAAEARAEAAESENKKLNQTLLERDQELASVQHKLQLAEEELEASESKVKELKAASDEGETHRTTGENLARKVQLLEEELDKAEKDLKETTEKLRQVDVKAEHFERQVQRLEQERDEWERKHGEAVEKYQQSKRELDEVVMQMESLVSYTCVP